MGKGFFHVFLNTLENQCLVLIVGTMNLKPGIFRVSWWVRDFNPLNQKQTNAQVWCRIYDLPIEGRGTINLFSIAAGDGEPLRAKLLGFSGHWLPK